MVHFLVDEPALIRRISGGYSCSDCTAVYHDVHRRPRAPGVCDVCGSEHFKRRADDNEDVLQDRLQTYREETAPVVEHYERTGSLRAVDGMASVDELSAAIETALHRATIAHLSN